MQGYRQQIETTEELAEWYNKKYSEMAGGWATPEEECHRHLDDLGVPFDKKRQLLDVGCGAGHFLKEATKRVQCIGIDISHVGIQFCEERLGPMIAFEANIETYTDFQRFDYITCMGSLEHVVDIDAALENIRISLKATGKAYFLVPNEKWPHEDQPNERTWTAAQWTELFEKHGLFVIQASTAWGDHQIALTCTRRDAPRIVTGIPVGDKLNCGSGQRPFEQKDGWINLDLQDKYSPDLVADFNDLSMFGDGSMEYVVAHHVLEHAGLGESNSFLMEASRVLKPGGSLLIFIPDIRALAQRWLLGQIDDYIFFVNVYGAYMGDEADRHKFGYSRESLYATLCGCGNWAKILPFNWRVIAGADLARDWWILAIEAIR